jgi:hypothetical protein
MKRWNPQLQLGNASAAAPEDVTARSSAMPRDSVLLYPNRHPKSAQSPNYWGVIKLQSGQTFWAGLWCRIVHGNEVFELRLLPRKDPHK